jgi:hypothetical protein
MVRFGSPEVDSVNVEDKDLSDVDLPIDNDAVFEEVRNDPQVDTPDMQVEGDWTYGTIADRISMEERVNNNKIRWDSFKQINWDNFTDEQEGSVFTSNDGLSKVFTSSSGVSLNKLTPSEKPSSFIDLGSAAPGPKSGFAAGDPGLGVPGTNQYIMDGRAGSSSAAVYNGNVVLDAEEGTRAVAYNPPGDAEVLQMVNREDWGHQARAVMESLTQKPGLGTSNSFKVPSFSTTNGQISLLAPYSYSYSRVLGVNALQTTFDIKAGSDTSMSFTLRDSSGKSLTSQNVDVSSGGQSVSVVFINAPPSGTVELDSGGTAFTVNNTEKFPPV